MYGRFHEAIGLIEMIAKPAVDYNTFENDPTMLKVSLTLGEPSLVVQSEGKQRKRAQRGGKSLQKVKFIPPVVPSLTFNSKNNSTVKCIKT